MAKFLIVEARFYADLNDKLIEGARAALEDAGHQAEVLTAVDFASFIGLDTTDGRENLARWHKQVSSRESAAA